VKNPTNSVYAAKLGIFYKLTKFYKGFLLSKFNFCIVKFTFGANEGDFRLYILQRFARLTFLRF